MDIAKIRKKLKEEEQKSGKKKEELAPKQEDRAAEGRKPEVRSQESAPLESPLLTGPEVNPQPAAPAQAVSEPGVIKGEKEKKLSESAGKTAKPEEAVSGIIELLTFQLAAEEFALRISEVEEILTPQQITPVPKAPDYILGITSVRGKVMPVLDLKKRLSIKDNGASGKSRKKILTLKGPKGRIGTMIDRINGVIRIDESEIAEPPAHLSESDLMFVSGVVLYDNRFISVIRLEEAANINLK